MTSNQRRPGFRLPWSSEEADAADAAAAAAAGNGVADAETAHDAKADTLVSADTAAEAPAAPAAEAPAAPAAESPTADQPEATSSAVATVEPAAPAAIAAPPASPETSAGFMRDLVAAMRRVAEETRQASLSELRTKAEEQVRGLESDAERRRDELKSRADADIAGVGEWARAEAERITQEAERRVVARRAQLDQQLAAETTRAEEEAKALRDRVAEYERELDAYHAQLNDIADPAAFAAAAKRMPAPPPLRGTASFDGPPAVPTAAAPAAATAAAPTSAEASMDEPAAPEVHPAEEEVLASRLAELDARLGPVAEADRAEAPAAAPAAEPTATEIVVKGLGSFGAITGFRQALASVEGIEGVSLSLGPTGEFVFRAIHRSGFDVAGAITGLEGEAARIEAQPDGSLKVSLDRAR